MVLGVLCFYCYGSVALQKGYITLPLDAWYVPFSEI